MQDIKRQPSEKVFELKEPASLSVERKTVERKTVERKAPYTTNLFEGKTKASM